jgi:hypothetical protein
MKIEQARIMFRNCGFPRDRAETISRLTFQHLGRMPDLRALAYANQRISSVEMPPLRLALSSLSDRGAARIIARHILEAVAKASGSREGQI